MHVDILNASFDIAHARADVLAAFKGAARKTLFNPGDRLYRLTSLPAGGFAGNGVFTSSWWYTQATYNDLVKTARRTNSTLVDTARSRLAVTKEWNPTMAWLVIVELTKPAYGWVGAIRHTPRNLNQHVCGRRSRSPTAWRRRPCSKQSLPSCRATVSHGRVFP